MFFTEGFIGIAEVSEDSRFWKAIVGEFVGTLVLVLVGCGSCLSVGSLGPSEVQIALTFGLVVATLAQVSKLLLSLLPSKEIMAQ